MRRLLIAGLVAFAAVSVTPAAANPRAHNGQIAFMRFDPLIDDSVIYTVNPDGSHARQVLEVPAQCPQWSPDGSRLTTCGFPPHGAAAIIDPDDGSFRVLSMPDPDRLFTACPLMSPDGARLTCEGFGEDQFENPTDPSLNGLYSIRSSDGGGLTRITANPGGDDLPGDYSSNGKRLVFGRSGHATDPDGLYTVKVDGTGVRRITPTGVILGPDSGGSWSPQGNRIVFARRIAADQRTTMWVVHADGNGLREIHVQGQPACGGPIADPATRGCFAPRWSPDGRKIVFTNFTAAAGRSIYTVNADGSGLTQVTDGDDDQSADWGIHPLAR
jgi:Tol biopolymer transport system component